MIGGDFMENLKLTDDSEKNIRMMLPHLNDEAREKISLVIFGSYLLMPKKNDTEISKSRMDEFSLK